MKKTLKIELLSFLIFVCFSLKIYGQHTYIGKIDGWITPPLYALQTGYYYHILTLDSWPISLNNSLIVNNIEYFGNDIVGITGDLRPIYLGSNIFELEIETMERWSLNQDIQLFLDMYLLECQCVNVISGDLLSHESYATIKECKSMEYDLLISIEIPVGRIDLKTYTFKNAFFIPRQENEERFPFIGGGEIRNDSLFLHYVAGSSLGGIQCDCKGEKITSSITFKSDKNKVYYDAAKQVIVIDETLQNQSSMFELVNIQGEVILRKTGTDNSSINVSNLSKGVYLYRLFFNSQEIYFGKILK